MSGSDSVTGTIRTAAATQHDLTGQCGILIDRRDAVDRESELTGSNLGSKPLFTSRERSPAYREGVFH